MHNAKCIIVLRGSLGWRNFEVEAKFFDLRTAYWFGIMHHEL